jgi:formylmethanofuran:tetrahydromethanopterin formyltransferase
MNLDEIWDSLFFGQFLDWCDMNLNYKAFHFFYSVLARMEDLRMSIVKRRRWNTPVILGDYCTKKELKMIEEIAGTILWSGLFGRY